MECLSKSALLQQACESPNSLIFMQITLFYNSLTQAPFKIYVNGKFSPATRISHAKASSRPPPRASPSMAAIVGTGRLAETTEFILHSQPQLSTVHSEHILKQGVICRLYASIIFNETQAFLILFINLYVMTVDSAPMNGEHILTIS